MKSKAPLPELDFQQANRLRDDGIKRAVDHAEQDRPGWLDNAYKIFVDKFLLLVNGSFMFEQFREYYQQMGYPPPPHQRAFGAIPVRARKNGIIRKVGIGPTRSPKQHRANATIWIKVKPSQQKQKNLST